MDNQRKEKIKKKLSSNIIQFGKVITPGMYQVESAPFHYDLGRILMNRSILQFNVEASRGHAKSSVVGGVFPLFHLMFDPGVKVIVLISRTQDHAIKLLGTIKDVLDYSANFRAIFGYWGIHSAKEWNKAQVQLKDGSMIVCKGIGQQLRGIKVINQRPTLIICDDLQDESNTKTKEVMEADFDWFLQTAVPSLDPKIGRIGNIATPQHQICVSQRLKEMDGWINRLYAPTWTDNTRKALWEAWVPLSKLEAKYNDLASINKKSVFYREYLCQIVGDEEQLFREEDIQYYRGSFFLNDDNEGCLHITELNGQACDRTIPINVFTGVDPASSTRQTADYSVNFNLGIDDKMNRWVLPYYRKHANPLDHAKSIPENFKTYRSARTRIESVGYQERLRQTVRAICEDEGLYIPGLEIKEMPRQKKSLRLESLQPISAQKKLYVMVGQKALIDEMLLYPRGKNDDLLDGLWLANKNCYAPDHSVKPTVIIPTLRMLRQNNKNSWQTS